MSSRSEPPAHPPVVVVGAGPTGLTLANLLGRLGVHTVVYEQAAATSELPRAVSFDDESLRTLQACGLQAEAYDVILQGTGTKYYGSNGRPFAYQRGPVLPPHGHPVKNPFSQPVFERMLLHGLTRFANVDVHFRSKVTGLTTCPDGSASLLVTDATGVESHVHAALVVAADGGRSTMRELASVRMVGSSFQEPWLVVDVTGDHHDQRYAMHHCDRERPYVIVAGRDGHCRYEFLVRPGDDVARLTQPDQVQRLLAPFRTVSAEQIERAAIYTFHALVAEHWRSGPVLFAGDAAHMMPPFAGQGLNSGIRDAVNLAWKIAAVTSERMAPELLDTYEIERRPHAEASVALSVRLGRLMRPSGTLRGRVREALIHTGIRVPSVRRWVSEGRFKPVARYGAGSAIVEPTAGAAATIVGSQLPQPTVLTGDGDRRLLDDVLGNGFALVTVAQFRGSGRPLLRHPVWDVLSPTMIELVLDDRAPDPDSPFDASIADVHGLLAARVSDLRGQHLLVRPDRFVAAVLPADPDDAAQLVERAFSALRLPVSAHPNGSVPDGAAVPEAGRVTTSEPRSGSLEV